MKTTEDILNEFNILTKINDHTGAAILLANHFGTTEENNKLDAIQREQNKRGYILSYEQADRDAISNKYYYRLKKQP
tara:strand:- start:3340 stop:3570 length:231 start_codon:yes stop_codon:yes gene_type:complete